MKRGLLDTDMPSYFLKGVPEVVEKARQYLLLYGTLDFSVITYYEIRRGLEWAGAHRKIADFEELTRVSMVLGPGPDCRSGGSANQCGAEEKSTPIDEADILIAGIARARGLAVITNNARHFAQVPNLEVENWLEDQ